MECTQHIYVAPPKITCMTSCDSLSKSARRGPLKREFLKFCEVFEAKDEAHILESWGKAEDQAPAVVESKKNVKLSECYTKMSS